jgi:hypothetical protein
VQMQRRVQERAGCRHSRRAGHGAQVEGTQRNHNNRARGAQLYLLAATAPAGR